MYLYVDLLLLFVSFGLVVSSPMANSNVQPAKLSERSCLLNQLLQILGRLVINNGTEEINTDGIKLLMEAAACPSLKVADSLPFNELNFDVVPGTEAPEQLEPTADTPKHNPSKVIVKVTIDEAKPPKNSEEDTNESTTREEGSKSKETDDSESGESNSSESDESGEDAETKPEHKLENISVKVTFDKDKDKTETKTASGPQEIPQDNRPDESSSSKSDESGEDSKPKPEDKTEKINVKVTFDKDKHKTEPNTSSVAQEIPQDKETGPGFAPFPTELFDLSPASEQASEKTTPKYDAEEPNYEVFFIPILKLSGASCLSAQDIKKISEKIDYSLRSNK